MEDDQICSLASLQDGIKVDNKKVQINPLVLFVCLTTLAQRQEDIKAQFNYELTPESYESESDGLMRKPTKSILRTHLTRNVITPKTPSKYVIIDGRALLYKVQWLWNSSYHDLANQYVKYLKIKHKNSIICVVFDGHNEPLATKLHEDLRRGAISSADVNVTDLSMQVTCTRKPFLQSAHNETELIRILRQRFIEIDIENEQSVGDADVRTVQKAIEIAKNHQTTVVSDNTDILVLLMFHCCSTMKDIVFAKTKQVNEKRVELSDKIFALAPSVLIVITLSEKKKSAKNDGFFC